jgi:hypothetical protein
LTTETSSRAARLVEKLRGLFSPKFALWYLKDDVEAQERAGVILEEGKVYTFGRYQVRVDSRALQPNQKVHNHVSLRGKSLGVINKDGTASHGQHKIPNTVLKAMKAKGLLDEAVFEEAALSEAKIDLSIPADLIARLESLVAAASKAGLKGRPLE